MGKKKKLPNRLKVQKLRAAIRRERGSLQDGPSALDYLLRERRREARLNK